ncbi:MAG TPA: SDR family NAD(P)-dependent oxidoreductase [Dehalococcoidales bacterium]|nr:SDR family NAD(P)-dependent oxidoreductase [Dehalococcoidales bacterium]
MGDLLKGKVAIVTGSGQGIGRGIAIGLAREGACVVTNNRKPESTGYALLQEAQLKALTAEQRAWIAKQQKELDGDAETTAAAIRQEGGKASSFFGDVADFNTAARLVQKTIDTYGRIDILINNAGTFRFCPIEEMTEEIWNHVFNVKPRAYFNCIRHVLPHMLKQKWGRILNCTSKAWAGDPLKHAHYAAANAAVVGLTRAVANELYHRGVMCNAFSPWARTRASFELAAYAMASQPGNQDVYKRNVEMYEKTPPPEYLGPIMAYLSSDLAQGISGTIFNVGGNSIGIHEEPIIKTAITKPGEPWTIDELKRLLPTSILMGYHSRAEKPR